MICQTMACGKNDYSYTTNRSGDHTIKLLLMPTGMYASVYVYNSGWEQIGYNTDMSEGDSMDIAFDSGKTYYIRVEYHLQVV